MPNRNIETSNSNLIARGFKLLLDTRQKSPTLVLWKSNTSVLSLIENCFMPKEPKRHAKILLVVGVTMAMLPCCITHAQNFHCSGSIQSCINVAAAAGGGNVILDDKTYFITQTIIPKSNVNLIGRGSGSVITWAPSVADTINAPMIEDDGTTALINVGFSNFRMQGTVDTTDLDDRDRGDHMAIFFDGPGDPADASSLRHNNIMIANLEVSQFGGIGIHIKGSRNVTCFDLDMYDNGWFPSDLLHNLYFLRVRDSSVIQTDPAKGFRASPSGHGLRMSRLENAYFEGLVVEDNADHGIHMDNVVNLRGYDITSRNNCQNPLGACGNIRAYNDDRDFDFSLSQPRNPYYFADIQAPYANHTVPGVIEAEAFDIGGSTFAYNDTSSGNSFGVAANGDPIFRNTDVDVVELNTGNYKVGYIADGEWLEYTADLQEGSYRVDFFASSDRATGGQVEVEIGGTSHGTAIIPSTGSWNNFQTFSLDDVTIENDSTLVIRLNFGGAGFDLDRFEFVQLSGPAVTKGDINLDGFVNFLDIAPLITILSSNGFQAEADCDCNGVVDFLDISPFITILTGG